MSEKDCICTVKMRVGTHYIYSIDGLRKHYAFQQERGQPLFKPTWRKAATEAQRKEAKHVMVDYGLI